TGASEPGELTQVLAADGQQFALTHPTQFKMKTVGAARDLAPLVREEMWLIGREALANAFRHAGAGEIEAQVSYGKHFLKLQIRDDGRGIDPGVLENGRPGHWGMAGMRERAAKIGASLSLRSRPGTGTQIEVQLSAESAYRDDARSSRHQECDLAKTP